MGKSTISMAIFNSYVKLPEGSYSMLSLPHHRVPFLKIKNYIYESPKKIESEIRSHSDNLLFYLFEITVNVVGYLTKIRTQLAVRVQQQLHHCDAVGTDGVAQRGDALVVLPVGVAHE